MAPNIYTEPGKVIFWNVANGLLNKLDFVKSIISEQKPIMIFIFEAEVKIEEVNFLKVQGYDIEISKTLETRGLGRTACFIKKGVKYQRQMCLEKSKNGYFDDIICIKIDKFLIAGVYKGFKLYGTETPRTKLLNILKTLHTIAKTNMSTVIAGDFNIDLNKSTAQLDALEEWSIETGMTQFIEGTTRQRLVHLKNGKSSIDHLYSNFEAQCTIEPGINSDHDLILLNLTGLKKLKTKKYLIRDWRGYSSEAVDNYFSEYKKCNDIPTNHESLTTLLLDALNKIAPIRTCKAKSDHILSPKIAAIKKRRDRFLKRYKQTNNLELFKKAKSMSKTLKKVIKKESRRTIQLKAKSENPKVFWNLINRLLGKNGNEELALEENVNGKIELISDPITLSRLFSDFFKEKVDMLADGKQEPNKIDRNGDGQGVNITMEILNQAHKTMVGKRSHGTDGIPQCLLKDAFKHFSKELLEIFNNFSNQGLPDTLKTARVLPLHKKESKTDKTNYRPISNLSSFSKLYEKCILILLERETNGMEGLNQHGFRRHHSTETALLTLQNEISKRLDKNANCLVYSIDLSAAFDMLNPEMFHKIFERKITPGLLNVLTDFLQNRTFQVDIEGKNDGVRQINRGCVQGSVLGPRIFSLYCGELEEKIKAVQPSKDIEIISYADDTYVMVTDTLENLQCVAQETMSGHVNYLKEIDMVVNENKTEATFFSRKPRKNKAERSIFRTIEVNNTKIKLQENMKALGVTFEKHLKWDQQFKEVLAKGKRMAGAMRHLRKHLTEDQFKKVLSTQLYSVMFYGSTVWGVKLTDKQITKLNSIFIRLLRIAVRDYNCKIKKKILIRQSGRATPMEWIKYQKISKVVKICRDKQPQRLYNDLMKQAYTERRRPGLMFFHSSARYLIGQQSLHNRLQCMRKLDPWAHGISNDELRIMLKRRLFKSYKQL